MYNTHMTNNDNNTDTTMTTTVIGRNGFAYDATQISSELFIVGKFIVVVEEGKCEETICRATKANVKRLSA
jgi:hypothetical protein